MTITESEEGRPKGGKPARGVRGRTTTTVRFTAARLADLREVAAAQGRSLSEEVEFRIEAHARSDAEMQALLAQLFDHQQQIGRLQQQVRTLQAKSAPDKESVAADERIARIVATAVARALDERKK
jgi:hypothetical protein